jgi:leucyl aminopeptidase
MYEHSLLRSLLCATALGFPAAALAQQSQWIVTGADVSQRFSAALAEDRAIADAPAAFAVASTTGGRTVAELRYPFEHRLQEMMHAEFHRCGGYTVHPSREAALAEANNPFYRSEYLQRRGLFQEGIDQQDHVGPALELVEPARIVETIGWMQEVGTRYYQSAKGQQAAETLKAQWESYAPGRADFSVELYDHGWTQDSVIATIRGAELPDEIVVVGGHLDSINAGNVADAPGADDDASGVAAVSEVLRTVLASGFTPRRTLQFMAYAAEEVGLLGSTEIAQDYAADPSREVVAALQMDMTGFAGSPQDMYFVTDYVSTDLTAFLKDLIATYNGPGPHAISFGETACDYACSDHAAWTRVGVPSAFPFEARFEDFNEAIHTPGDLLDRLDTSGGKQAKFAKLGVEFMMEVAKAAGEAPAGSASETMGFVWGDAVSAGEAAGGSGHGPVSGERDGVGSYEVTFGGVGRRAGVEVRVAGFGEPSARCAASSVAPAGADLVVGVRCQGPDGAPMDSRHSVLVTLP